MIIYTEKYTESNTRIKNNNLLYKTHQRHQNTFRGFDIFRTESNKSNFYFIIYQFSIIHILYISPENKTHNSKPKHSHIYIYIYIYEEY